MRLGILEKKMIIMLITVNHNLVLQEEGAPLQLDGRVAEKLAQKTRR